MGVNYYSCKNCNSGYRDDDVNGCCCECDKMFCSRKCGKLQNYQDWDDDRDEFETKEAFRIDQSIPVTCVFCRKEKCTDEVLLDFLLNHYEIDYKQAVAMWRNED